MSNRNPINYRLKTGKAAETAVNAYKEIEDTVVGAYQRIEDAFVERFLEPVDDGRGESGEKADSSARAE